MHDNGDREIACYNFLMRRGYDMVFLWITISLAGVGFFIFISALLGLLAREGGRFSGIAINQGVSLAIGIALLYAASRIKYSFWNRYAFFIFLAAIAATLLIFVPFLGFEHGGARRWISVAGVSFQPGELLKFAFVLYLAAWYATVKTKIATWQWGVGPLAGLLAISGIILGLQPDLGTFIIMAVTGLAMFFVAGGGWKHTVALILGGSLVLSAAGLFVPYVQDRLLTFVDPSRDPLGAGYQIQQSLIAVGSGQFFGRGFGQSVQKFNFLPEPIGDSIFAVFAEEWGFLGSSILIVLFLAFMLRGYRIAQEAPNTFGRLAAVGFVTMIVTQSFINIASMLGVFPLTGDPLVFVSQGGSSLVMALTAAGVVLNISKFRKGSESLE